MNALEKAKELINEYSLNEFGSEADFTNLDDVGLAYTTITNWEIPIQASVDLLEYVFFKYIDNVLIDMRKYDTLEELICHELQHLNFDDLVDYTADELYEALNA